MHILYILLHFFTVFGTSLNFFFLCTFQGFVSNFNLNSSFTFFLSVKMEKNFNLLKLNLIFCYIINNLIAKRDNLKNF